MRQFSTIAFVGMLAVTMAGCGSGSEESSNNTPGAPAVVKTQPVAESFDKPPMVAQNPEKSVISSPSVLIQPTNPNERAKQVEKGRTDPFADILVSPISRVPTTPTTPRPVPRIPSLPVARPPQPVAVRPKPPIPEIPSPSQESPLPLPPDSTSEPDFPLQEPDLAKGIAVSGVVQIGSETLAIVQVPNEGTSRYVREGQLLSNGQVLVKRIEVNQGPAPIVVLEQYGIEVAKAVGEEAVNQAETDTPSAAVPVTPSPASGEELVNSTPVDGRQPPLARPTQDTVPVPPPPANNVSPGA